MALRTRYLGLLALWASLGLGGTYGDMTSVSAGKEETGTQEPSQKTRAKGESSAGGKEQKGASKKEEVPDDRGGSDEEDLSNVDDIEIASRDLSLPGILQFSCVSADKKERSAS